MPTIRFPASLAVGALGLTGCTAGPDEGSTPSAEETVQLQPDYPAYEQDSLVSEAVLVVSGTVTGAEDTVLTPEFEGSTPEENPLLGLSEEEKQEAMDQAEGVPATAITLQIDETYKGGVAAGDEVVIVQTGGVIDGVQYDASGTTIMTEDSRYMVFAEEGREGAYNVLGGSAGLYLDDGEGAFEAVDPAYAPFESLTADEASALVDDQQ